MSKKFYDDAHDTHTKWVEYLFEQDAAQMAQIAAAEQEQAQQAAQMQAQQVEQEMLALRQGVGGAVGELITVIFQLSQKGGGGVRQAKAAVSAMSAVFHNIASNQTDPNKAAQDMGGIIQRAAADLQKLGG